MGPMDLMFVAGLMLALATGWCVARVRDIDRELRQLLPASVERRWWRRLASAPIGWAEPLWPYFVPAHWQRQLHSGRGAALIHQMMLFAGIAVMLAMVALGLVALAITS